MNVPRYISLLLLFSLSCGTSASGSNTLVDVTPGTWLRGVPVDYEADAVMHRGLVQMYIPKNYAGVSSARTLIVLHGFRQQPGDWEKSTPIAEYADAYRFVLVCPAMSTTLYESKYFPETENKWAPVPGGEYIMKVLIPFLRSRFGLAVDRERTGIFGISTGARGALLLAARYNDVFGAAAGLSGDYDSASLKQDRLVISVYGPYDANKERWEDEVNIIKLAERLKKTPVFLGHGARDSVVLPPQTKMLSERLTELHNDRGGYELEVDQEKSRNAGHDWNYWASMVPDVLRFFDQKLGK